MELNLPVITELSNCRNLLIAGMGGGFDIFSGLPIFLTLRAHGVNAHLASLSFAQTEYIKTARRLSKQVVEVTGDSHSPAFYVPEIHLSRWFREHRGEEISVWCFDAQGGAPLFEAFSALSAHLDIDGILLVDGGVDSLVRGNEAAMGTVIEDACSLSAVARMNDISVRMIACIGFGAERDLAHAHILQNMSDLAAAGAYLGACALVNKMEVCCEYEAAVEYAHAQRGQDQSVINASIVSAVRGHYGDFHLTERTKGSRLWISPLMPIYWFYDLQTVAARSLILPLFEQTTSFGDALRMLAAYRASISPRPSTRIPLE